MVNKQNISQWTKAEWEADRQKRKTIGGSDAGTILGLSPYKSAYTLWAEKSGTVPVEDISSKEAVRLGNDLEYYVAERWMEKTGKKLRKDNNILTNPDYPFAHANIDRRVVGEPDAGFEAKTTSNWNILADCRNGKFPDVWLAQVTHYMMVTGAKRWYLAILVFGHGFFDFVIERDEDDVTALSAVEREFYQRVIDNEPPEIDGTDSTSETIKAIFTDSEDGTTADLSGLASSLAAIKAIKAQIAELENAMQEHEQRIQIFMGDSEKGVADGVAVSWKTQSGRSTFDRKAFEADNGAIDQKYYKVGKPSRPFKITFKEDK